MNKIIVSVLFIALFFIYGCADAVTGFANEPGGFVPVTEVKIMEKLEPGINASCYCMFCENGTDTTLWIFENVGSLRNGTCYFMKDCNYTTAMEKLENKNATLKSFMIGTGTTFADFNYANYFCQNGQDLAVKWVGIKSVGSGYGYINQEGEKAGCMLNNNVIPMYVLYSRGLAVSDISGAKKIAAQMKNQGPVIITTELNYSINDAQYVATQAIEMKKACPNCLIALAPAMEDRTALDEVMKTAKNSVDLIAFGIDSANYKLGYCDPNWLIYYATNFSQYAMEKYQKPSIIPYMLIREGTNSSDGVNNCTWEPGSNAMLNSEFFLLEMSNMIGKGMMVGAAKYSYTGANDPLNCTSCSEVYLDPLLWSAGELVNQQMVPNEPMFSHWYAFCSIYSYLGERTSGLTGDKTNVNNKMLVIFPNQSNTSGCQIGLQNVRLFKQFPDFGEKSYYKEYTKPSNLQSIPADKWNNLGNPAEPNFACSYCIDAEYGGESPGSSHDPLCDAFPELDVYADKFDIDPWLFRAVVQHESGLSSSTTDVQKAQCAVAIVAPNYEVEKKYNSAGGFNGIYIFPGDYGCFGHKSKVNEGVDVVEGPCTLPALPDDLTYCAFGLTAVTEHPYQHWIEGSDYTGGDYSQTLVKEVCFENFNPLNATHSACLGAYKFRAKWDISVGIVNVKMATTGSYFGSEAKSSINTQRKYTAAITLEQYRGGWQTSWIGKYDAVMNSDGTCEKLKLKKEIVDGQEKYSVVTEEYSPKDFVDYLKNCECHYDNDHKKIKCRDYSDSIINKGYKSLISRCARSDCPNGRLQNK